MGQNIFKEEHEIYRASFKKFYKREFAPHVEAWEESGDFPRTAWKQLAENGFLCPWLDEKYGGSGADFLYSVVLNHELGRELCYIPLGLHSDIVAPYIYHYATEEQKSKWLPGCASGDILLAVAMTEPGSGSDLQSISTTAIKDGDDYVLNGQKVFITNGIAADLLVVACKTDPKTKPAHKGISLVAVEAGTPGFTKVRNLKKMGCHISNTAELVFEDCHVPRSNLIGEEGKGFVYLMHRLAEERLIVAIQAQAIAEAILDLTLPYCKQRVAFGRPIGQFQHNTFKIVEMATELELGRTLVNDLILDHIEGKDIMKRVSMAKWWITEMANRVAYHCVQLHGGYGYMDEYKISRAYRDVRVTTIGGGTTEIMKTIIGNMMGF